MSETNQNNNTVPTKAEAFVDQKLGFAKETMGNAFGNSEMQSNGVAQRNEGQEKEATNKVAGFLNKVNNEVQGTVKGIFSTLSGKSSERK